MMVLDRYDEEVYTVPVWEGDTVYHEDVLFFRGRKQARLLYPIDEIIAVKSYDLQHEYREHEDYEIKGGELVRTENSAIPVYDVEPLTDKAPCHVFKSTVEGMYLSEPDCIVMRQLSVAVTYKHSRMWENGYRGTRPQSLENILPFVFERLKYGEELNILIYGDSMSSGWGSSGARTDNSIFDATNTGSCVDTGLYVSPYSPAWYDLMQSVLQKKYPCCKINLENISLGGKDSRWGAVNVKARMELTNNTPHLLMIGFGINDACGEMDTREYKSNIETIIRVAEQHCGETLSVMLFSPHICNADALCYPTGRFLEYEKMLCEIVSARNNTGVVPLSSVFADIARSKCALDRLENNINHCMDMGGRIYAQSMVAALSHME